jgi:hypothetical protein
MNSFINANGGGRCGAEEGRNARLMGGGRGDEGNAETTRAGGAMARRRWSAFASMRGARRDEHKRRRKTLRKPRRRPALPAA